MKKRLKVYFIHSTKFNYNDLLYKPVLLSSVCVFHDLILPMSDKYKNKYAKDLINSADIIVALINNPSWGSKLELKWAQKYKKPILFLSLDNKIPRRVRKYVSNIEMITNDKPLITLIENYINEIENKKEQEEKGKPIILGQI